MAILKPEDLDKVKRRQIQNILAKQAAGKTLSAREERALAEAASDLPPGAENFVKTYDELAGRLNVSRKSIQNWQRKLPESWPRPRADGRHEVAAWVQFMAAHHLAGAEPDGHPDDRAMMTVSDWKAEELKLKCEKLQLENAKVAGDLVEAAEVETGLSSLVAGFRQALNNLPGRLAQKILNVSDFHEAEELISQEVNVVLKTLQNADFLEAAPATQVNAVNPVTQAAADSKTTKDPSRRHSPVNAVPSKKKTRPLPKRSAKPKRPRK
ncbi:MAG: hypothetical protein IPK22_11180 [Verrucomicrobiaceae bacterium]|nr:hypothetical protein [Verrucomicrobiaceae bacterium]